MMGSDYEEVKDSFFTDTVMYFMPQICRIEYLILNEQRIQRFLHSLSLSEILSGVGWVTVGGGQNTLRLIMVRCKEEMEITQDVLGGVETVVTVSDGAGIGGGGGGGVRGGKIGEIQSEIEVSESRLYISGLGEITSRRMACREEGRRLSGVWTQGEGVSGGMTMVLGECEIMIDIMLRVGGGEDRGGWVEEGKLDMEVICVREVWEMEVVDSI
ncbi:hypothetical protein Tco_0609980 [Tanacetum coccineum]